MPFFRSVEMQLCEMVLHQDNAYDCLIELGYLGKVHFKEDKTLKNRILNREHVHNIQRCTELQKIIVRFHSELQRLGLKVSYEPPHIERHMLKMSDLNHIENELIDQNNELNCVIRRCRHLNIYCNKLREQRAILQLQDQFFSSTDNVLEMQNSLASDSAIQLEEIPSPSKVTVIGTASATATATAGVTALNFLAGSAPIKNFAAFELMIWRVSRGKTFVQREEYRAIEMNEYNDPFDVLKYTFILAYIGDEMHKKLLKVCTGFDVKIYNCPIIEDERKQLFRSVSSELTDAEEILMQTIDQKQRILNATTENLSVNLSKINKIKDVYLAISKFENVVEFENSRHKYLFAECWIPMKKVNLVHETLLRGAYHGVDGDAKNAIFPPILNKIENKKGDIPPTLFHTNSFSLAYQSIIDTYGVASYRELNPAPFLIITFPFFFAIMFADIGHGLLLILAASFLIWKKDKYSKLLKRQRNLNEIVGYLIRGRYIILSMGICSIYTGLIYNNIFSKPLNIFGSAWTVNYTQDEVETFKSLRLDPAREDNYGGKPYLFGIDPIWEGSTLDSIKMKNSLRMKVAFIIGVVHMIVGLLLLASNAVHFEDRDQLYLQFLPKICFVTCVFIYPVALIFLKWFTYGSFAIPAYGPRCAPSLLIVLLDTYFALPNRQAPAGCFEYMYENQPLHQYLCLCTAIISIIVLLLGYPIRTYLHQRHRREKSFFGTYITAPIPWVQIRREKRISWVRSKKVFIDIKKIEKKTKMEIYDIFYNQIAITAELVLGSVSHIASYLRLWAVSMAHEVLSSMVWDMILGCALQANYGYLSSLIIFIAFAIFALFTIVFLVFIDGLAIFLHTMRLHVFDFHLLFFKGQGYIFAPFHFKKTRI